MSKSTSSPRRRSPKKGTATASPSAASPKDVALEMPAISPPRVHEELKEGDEISKGVSSQSSATNNSKSVGFFTEPSSPSTSDADLGPGVKVLSPTRTQSTVMQTGGVEICFHQLTLQAHYVGSGMKRKTRRILKGISGITRKGTCTALMGPSGCGKSSLLHTLAGKNNKANISGHILVDGKPRESGFAANIGYVEQDDQLCGLLTVRENLTFSAQLRLPVTISNHEKDCRVEDTIELLGMWKCANSKIGTDMIRGVSGGERKRCSIGMELVVDPAVIFLDEPTSGLDAFTAHKVVEILADLAANGKTVVLSIHQPRFTVFKLFDNLMLLAEGEMVYQGPGTKGVEYFAGIGFQCEPFNNPCDFFMDVVCDQVRRLDRQISYGGSVHVQEMGFLARSFMNSAEGKAITAECEAKVLKTGGVVNAHRKMDKHVRHYATSFAHQFAVISKRVFLAVMRNPATSVFQVLSFIASAVLLGAFFYGKLGDGPTAMQAHIGCMFMVSYMIIFSAITSLELFIQERSLFVHEKTSGFYRTSAYFLAKVFCEILPTRLIPTLFYAVITAYMAGMRTDFYHLSMYWLTLTVTSITSTSLCLLVSSCTAVFSAAFLGCGAFYLLFMLASGFVLQADQIPVYLAPFKYMSFYRYCLQNLLALDLKGRTFHCATPEQLAQDPGSISICMPTGDLYLQSQQIDPDNIWRNIGILFAMTPGYLFLAYLCLRNLKKKS